MYKTEWTRCSCGSGRINCSYCGGRGRASAFDQSVHAKETCPECRGSGTVVHQLCKGSGMIETEVYVPDPVTHNSSPYTPPPEHEVPVKQEGFLEGVMKPIKEHGAEAVVEGVTRFIDAGGVPWLAKIINSALFKNRETKAAKQRIWHIPIIVSGSSDAFYCSACGTSSHFVCPVCSSTRATQASENAVAICISCKTEMVCPNFGTYYTCPSCTEVSNVTCPNCGSMGGKRPKKNGWPVCFNCDILMTCPACGNGSSEVNTAVSDQFCCNTCGPSVYLQCPICEEITRGERPAEGAWPVCKSHKIELFCTNCGKEYCCDKCGPSVIKICPICNKSKGYWETPDRPSVCKVCNVDMICPECDLTINCGDCLKIALSCPKCGSLKSKRITKNAWPVCYECNTPVRCSECGRTKAYCTKCGGNELLACPKCSSNVGKRFFLGEKILCKKCEVELACPKCDGKSSEETRNSDKADNDQLSQDSLMQKHICPNCSTSFDKPLKFCGECGSKMKPEYVCGKCGQKFDRQLKFCGECGSKM